MKKSIIAIVALVILLAGGGAYYYFGVLKKTAPAPVADAQQQGAAQQQGTDATQQAADTNKVQAQDVKVGTGKEATPNSQVTVKYIGMLSDGTVFDSSDAHENKSMTFILGSGNIIPGFQIGVNGMKEGGERLMAIPPSLGYGDTDLKDPTSGKVIIPAKSTIVFRVQLVKVEAAPAAAATAPAATVKKTTK